MVNVGLARSDESYEAVRKALDLIGDDVRVPDDRPVLIKPNMVSTKVDLSATPVDAVRATMDFLQEKGVQKFTVAEGSAGPGDTMHGFERYGFYSLREEYDVEFKDLNQDAFVVFEALDGNLAPAKIRLARSLFDSYLVSVARMKTHNQVIATLSIKNVAIGSIRNADRHSRTDPDPGPGVFSHDPQSLNLSLARLNQTLSPDLAVIDGVVGMEGSGPVGGTPVPSGVAVASTDPLAADSLGTELMGLDWRTIGYLWYLRHVRGLSQDDIHVVGEDPSECGVRYEPHERMPWQLRWWVENWNTHLDGDYLMDQSEAPRD